MERRKERKNYNEKSKKITRREFIKNAAEITAGGLGAYGLYKVLEELKRQKIENSPEGIYYLLTGKKIDLEVITWENYNKVLNNLKEKFEKILKVKGEIKKFNDIDEGIAALAQEKGTVILVLWPTREYPIVQPSLGILEEAGAGHIKVWDPNKGDVEYIKSLEVWRRRKRQIVYLSLDKKIQISGKREKEIESSIEEEKEP